MVYEFLLWGKVTVLRREERVKRNEKKLLAIGDGKCLPEELGDS